MGKEGDFGEISYALGVLSIVFGILQPVFGLGMGITGFILSMKDSSPISRKAKKLNVIGVVLSAVITLILVIGSSYLISKGLIPQNLG